MCTAMHALDAKVAADNGRTVSRQFVDYVMARLAHGDQRAFAQLLADEGVTIDQGLATAPNAGMPQGKLATDPPSSEAQRRAAWAAVRGHSNLGISPSAGKKILGKDAMAHDEAGFAARYPDAMRIGVA
jgi:hypothetical protein